MSLKGLDLSEYDVLPDAIISRYQGEFRRGNTKSLNLIILHNMRLVVKISHTYRPPYGYEWDDLIMTGMQGLRVAAHRWRLNGGASFATYSSWYIRGYIRRFIQRNSNPVHVPAYFNAHRAKALREQAALEQELGVQVGSDDPRISPRARKVLAQAPKSISLDVTGPDGEFFEVADPGSCINPNAWGEEEYAVVRRLIRELPERLQVILNGRFGFGSPPLTLEQVGSNLHITRERVRQLELSALFKLRNRFKRLQHEQNLHML